MVGFVCDDAVEGGSGHLDIPQSVFWREYNMEMRTRNLMAHDLRHWLVEVVFAAAPLVWGSLRRVSLRRR